MSMMMGLPNEPLFKLPYSLRVGVLCLASGYQSPKQHFSSHPTPPLSSSPHDKSNYPLDVRVLVRLRAFNVCSSANIQTNLELVIEFPILIFQYCIVSKMINILRNLVSIILVL